MHGGLSPDLNNISDIERLPRPTEIPDTGKRINKNFLI